MKCIVVAVIGAHFFILFLMPLTTSKKATEHKPIEIKTVVQAPPPSLPAPTTQTVSCPDKSRKQRQSAAQAPKQPAKAGAKKRPAPSSQKPQRKPAAKKSPPAPQIPEHLVRQLQESIAKIEQTRHKGSWKNQLQTPATIAKLTVQGEAEAAQADYASCLIAYLQRHLTLPEQGEVKVELVIDCSGSLKRCRVIDSKSLRNQRHLENELSTIRYPAFTGSLKSKQEHAFVISFSNH